MNADTNWITPGAEVLVYTSLGRNESTHPVKTTIKRVAAKSFSVTAENEPRFDLEDQRSPQQGRSSWSGHYRRVVPIDSDEAREVIAAENRLRIRNRARKAVDAWIKDRTRDSRLAAIAALEAVED